MRPISFQLRCCWLCAGLLCPAIAAATEVGEGLLEVPEDTAAQQAGSAPALPPAEAPPRGALSSVTEPGTALVLAAPSGANWYDDLDLDLYLSSSLVLPVDGAPTRRRPARTFDRDMLSIKVDVAQLVLQREAEKPGDVGFRLELVRSGVLPQVLALGDVGIWQAMVSAMVPIGSGLRLDAGTFSSEVGTEALDGYDHTYDNGDSFEQSDLNYSRSLLFLTVPPLLTGLRVAYDFFGSVHLDLLLVNGWQPNVLDLNTGKTLGLQCLYFWAPGASVALHYLVGAERRNNDRDLRHLLDAVVAVHGPWGGLKLEGLFAVEQDGAQPLRQRGGALAVGRLELTHSLAVALRGEVVQGGVPFDDDDTPDALLPGLPQGRLVEFTLTPSLRLGESLLGRLEGRYDRALGGATPFAGRQEQATVAVNLAFVF